MKKLKVGIWNNNKMNTLNKFLLIIIFAISLYVVFLILSDFKQVYEKFYMLKSEYLLPIIILAPSSWLILFLRWHLLLKNSNINIPKKESLKINLAGYALSITPGKVGEFFKAHFMKTKFGVPQKQIIPIVVAEQFYTLLGLTLVGIIGIWYFEFGLYVMVITASIVILAFITLSSSFVFQKFTKLLPKIPFLSKYAEPIVESRSIIKASLRGKIFFYATALSFLFWMVESIIVYFVVLSFDLTLEFFNVTSIYATSILLGLVSFLPLGIGVVEGSLAGFFTIHGIDMSTALILVIMIRIFTRWYGVSVGLVALKLVGGFSMKNTNPKA